LMPSTAHKTRRKALTSWRGPKFKGGGSQQ
jgi:hypothetical protein